MPLVVYFSRIGDNEHFDFRVLFVDNVLTEIFSPHTHSQAPASPFHAWVMHFFKLHSGVSERTVMLTSSPHTSRQ